MDKRRRSASILVNVTHDEALVLFELLHRWEDDEVPDHLPFVDDAERIALHNLSAALEPLIGEAFLADYPLAIESARASVRFG